MTAATQDALLDPPVRDLVRPAAGGELRIVVRGTPIAQGSKRVVTGRGGIGRPHVIDSNDKVLRPWRAAVRDAATDVLPDGTPLPVFDRGTPVEVVATFTFARPKSHYRTGKNSALLRDDAPFYVASTPDADKLLRTMDSLTEAGVWHDDSQVVHVSATKVYAGVAHPDALEVPGAVIRLRAAP